MKLRDFIKSRKGILILSLINSILLTVATLLWINHSYILTDDEEYLIKGSTILRNAIIKDIDKPSKDSVLFINICWEKQLTAVKNEQGQVIGNRPVTDRQRLSRFLKYLNQNPEYRFILLDVWFKDSTDFYSDSLFQTELGKTKNILIPYHKDDRDDAKKDTPIFQAPVALSDYEKDNNDNNFVKFRLMQGSGFKTTPLVLYEKLHGKSYQEGDLWNYLDGKMSLNSFILSMRISNWDLQERRSTEDSSRSEALYTKVQLSELLDLKLEGVDSIPLALKESMNETFRSNLIREVTKNKILVVGDFEDSDIHETIYGPAPGPLILYNVYLALKEGDSIITPGFIFFLLAGFFVISLKCFSRIDPIDKYIIGPLILLPRIRAFLASFISYVIYLGLLSVVSYFLFNIHLTILLIAIYLELLEQGLQALKIPSQV